VTLRGARMYEFFDRLVNIAMPRIRDFRGVSNRAFDGRAITASVSRSRSSSRNRLRQDRHAARDEHRNYHTAKTDDEARALLAAFRFPFKHWKDPSMASSQSSSATRSAAGPSRIQARRRSAE